MYAFRKSRLYKALSLRDLASVCIELFRSIYITELYIDEKIDGVTITISTWIYEHRVSKHFVICLNFPCLSLLTVLFADVSSCFWLFRG